MPEPTDVRVEAAITAMLDTRMADGDLWATSLYAMLPVCRHWHKGGEQDVRDFLREPVRATLAASPVPGEWKDIATAPTDGTPVVVWCPAYEGLDPLVTRAAYHPDAGWCVDELRTPTHWMEEPGIDPAPPSHDPGAAEARIYVASRASVPERGAMWRAYRAEGCPVVSSWIDECGEGQTADMGELWQRILAEVRQATALVLYVGQDDLPLKGAYVEVGMALALGKPVHVVCAYPLDGRSLRPLGSWAAHPLVTFHPAVDDALAAAGWTLRQVRP